MSTPDPASLPIRPLTPRDVSACADLSENRGWPREEHKWGLLLAAGTGYGIDDPDGGLVTACVVTSTGLTTAPTWQRSAWSWSPSGMPAKASDAD